MIDESLSKAYLEFSRGRTGGFSWDMDGPFMKPFPTPYLARVTVFIPLASNPTTGSNETLGFFGGWSCFGGTFLLEDGWLWFVPLGIWPPSFYLAAYDLIMARLLAASIYAKVDECT